jgi:hypothetical protein
MHAFLSGLLASALFVHAIYGCCWHHAQCTPTCNHAIACTTTETECCDHSTAPAEGNQPQPPCDDQRDCQGVCNYLPSHKTQLDSPLDLAALDFPESLPANASAQLVAIRAAGEPCDPRVFEPPLRLHLLHQLLLI